VKYRWLLFDADGTLFDFERAATTALADTFRQLIGHYEPRYHEIYERINKKAWRDFEAGHLTQDQLRTQRFAGLFEALSLKTNVETFADRYLQNLSGHTELLPDAEDVVKQLADSTKLMIITNGLKEVQRPRFAAASITKYFADVVISEEVGSAKPHEGIFNEAFKLMGQPARHEVLIIGDSLTSDIQGGNNYGLDTCWYNPQGCARDHDVEIQYEIKSLLELLSIVSDA